MNRPVVTSPRNTARRAHDVSCPRCCSGKGRACMSQRSMFGTARPHAERTRFAKLVNTANFFGLPAVAS